MKGVCLIICLMLARDIAGSIFRPQFDPRMTDLVVQPLELLRDQRTIERHQQNGHHHSQHWSGSSEASGSRSEDSRADDNTSSDYHHSNAPIHAWNSALYSTVIGHANEQHNYDNVMPWRSNQIAEVPTSVINDKDYKRSSIFYDALITMKHMTEEEKKRFHEAYQTAVQSSNEDIHLNAPQLLKKNHYEVEEHTVNTDDGYMLTLFRIPAKQGSNAWSNKENSNEQSKESTKEESKEQTGEANKEQEANGNAQKSPVVFLMHGLLGSADDWLLMGPGKSLAYLLADAGYDVWLGNARGSRYSRHHVSKHPAQPDFWQFTTDEIALHDLPAMIDYTLNKTKQQKLVYVGHSQGTTAFFALASTQPEYNEKIKMMYAISPMVYMENARSPLLRMIAASYHSHGGLKDDLLGKGEFNPNKILIELAGGNMCEYEFGCKDVCSNVHFVMAGVNPDNVDVSRIPVIMSHLPAGTSIRQVKQYAQAAATHDFKKYDYGVEINEQMYGQPEPPKYDISQVNVPVALYYSEKDWLSHPKDVERLRQELPNVKDAYKVPEVQFAHTDFQFSKQAPEVVYKRLIKSIEKYQE